MDVELSEEQRIELEERRQRSEKISRLMGPYLLKRYRMLSETCNVCKVNMTIHVIHLLMYDFTSEHSTTVTSRSEVLCEL